MKRIKVSLCFCLVLVLTALSVSTVLAETDNTTEPVIGSVSDSGLIYSGYIPELPEDLPTEGSGEEYPESCDLRDINCVTPVKDQDGNGVCWAFGSMASFESSVSNLTGLSTSYSEESMRYVLSDYFYNAFGRSPDTGYYLRGIAGAAAGHAALPYLTNANNPVSNEVSWLTPNLESDIPYNSCTTWPSNISTAYANAYASEIRYISVSEIKKYLNEGKGVFITFCSNGNYLNSSTGAFNNREVDNDAAHAVELIGWDDNYEKENFKESCRPQNDGAWLIKNSWGTGWGDNGYGWISYEDVSFNVHRHIFVINNVKPVSKNERMLSYDFTPMFDDELEVNLTNTNRSAYIANVYDVSNLATDYGEINKVMLYSKDIGASYTVYLVPLGENDTMPSPNNLPEYSAFGTVNYEGYVTADINPSFSFSEDTKKIAVIVQFSYNSNNKNVLRLTREVTSPSYYNAVSHSGESYYYNGSGWTDVTGGSQVTNTGNFCIRPTIVRRESITNNSTLSTYYVRNQNKDISVNINLNGNQLYSIKQSGNVILREGIHFTRSGNKVTFKKAFLDTLSKTSDTRIVFNFTDGTSRTLAVRPPISSVSISGKCAEGHTLAATAKTAAGATISRGYVNFQWQRSSNGSTWSNISGATSHTYTLTSDDFMNYIRVRVSPKDAGELNTLTYTYSTKTATKVVLFGDANLDHEISIRDASEVQLAVAQLTTPFNDEQKLAADVDGDGEVTINDASLIQLYLSQNISDFPVNET